jgi:hypothetical protein
MITFEIAAGSAFAQQDSITNQDLFHVAEVTSYEINKVKKTHHYIDSLLEGTSLTSKRFFQIMKSRRNFKGDTLHLTPEEKETYDNVQPKVIKYSKKKSIDFMEFAKSIGLSMKRLRYVGEKIKSNPQLMKRYKNFISDSLSFKQKQKLYNLTH